MNSPWHLIGGVVKYFRFSFEYVLWEISYANLNMLMATIPSYESPDEKDEVTEVEGIADLANYLGL